MSSAGMSDPSTASASSASASEAPSELHPPAGFAKPRARAAAEPFIDTYYLKLNSLDGIHALEIRFGVLVSHHGFKQQADAWAIYYRRGLKREVEKTAVKLSFEINSFAREKNGIRLGPCSLELPTRSTDSRTPGRPGRSQGLVQSKGRSISWDLALEVAHAVEGNLVPESLQRLGLVKSIVTTLEGDLRVSGTSTIDGKEVIWTHAAGMLGRVSGPSSPHSWVWGHSNIFSDEKGQPAEFVFEGITARARLLGPVPAPKLSSLYFLYRGKAQRFNTFWDSVRIRSKHSLTDWKFQADHEDLSFRGHATAEHRDFAGLTFEDTNGGLLYCANSRLANLQIHVYRRGKLEAAFYSNGAAAFEVVSHQKNPYVPILL